MQNSQEFELSNCLLTDILQNVKGGRIICGNHERKVVRTGNGVHVISDAFFFWFLREEKDPSNENKMPSVTFPSTGES